MIVTGNPELELWNVKYTMKDILRQMVIYCLEVLHFW